MWNSIADTFKKYIHFGGKADRREFWTWTITMIAISAIIISVLAITAFINALFYRNTDNPLLSGTFTANITVLGLFWLVIFLPSLTVSVRRLRDAGFTPWLLIIPAVLNTITFFVLCDCALANMDGNTSFYSDALAFYLLSIAAVSDIIMVYLFCQPSK